MPPFFKYPEPIKVNREPNSDAKIESPAPDSNKNAEGGEPDPQTDRGTNFYPKRFSSTKMNEMN